MNKSDIDLYRVSEIELTYKTGGNVLERPKVKCAKDAYEILIRSWDENKIGFVEQAKVMLLNRANHVLGICEISTGGISGTVVDPRIVFVAALKGNASSIILAHNHPSGNLRPSEMDKRLTEKLMDGGKLLDIPVLDHLILSPEGYYSFADNLTY